MGNWSDLTSDMLECINSYLSLPDHHRFSAVCHEWRLVAKEKRLHPFAPQLPWLVLGEDPQTKKRDFFNLSEQKYYSMDIPEMVGQYVCGSSFGWLFLMDPAFKCRLLNPFSTGDRESFELPPLPRFGHTCDIILEEEPVYNSKGAEIGYTFKEMQRMYIYKAVLSHDPTKQSDFTAMVLFGRSPMLATWRPGDVCWPTVEFPSSLDECSGLSDVICFDGKFYAVSSRSTTRLFVVDVGSDHRGPKLIRVKPKLPRSFRTIERYLVEFKGELLLVLRLKSKKRNRGPTRDFKVLKVDLKTEMWNEVDKIDGLALFVGNNSSAVLDPTRYPGCVEDGIYFSDMCDCEYLWKKRGRHDFGVYNLVDQSFGKFCPVDSRIHPPQAPLRWITPPS